MHNYYKGHVPLLAGKKNAQNFDLYVSWLDKLIYTECLQLWPMCHGEITILLKQGLTYNLLVKKVTKV